VVGHLVNQEEVLLEDSRVPRIEIDGLAVDPGRTGLVIVGEERTNFK
jgi:hypothetical protein